MELRYKLVEVTREISNSSWMKFARCQLYLPENIIDDIAYDYHGNIREQKSQMLQRWHERTEVIAEYLYILVEKFFINKLRQRFSGNLDSQPNTKETHGPTLCQEMSIPKIHCGSNQIKLLQIFQKVTSEIPTTDWLEFVRCYLDLPEYVIDDIKYDHHSNICEQKFQMLQQWHEKNGSKVIVEYLYYLVQNFLWEKPVQCVFEDLDSQPATEKILHSPSSSQEMSELLSIFQKVTSEISITDWLEFVRCYLDLPEYVINCVRHDHNGNISEQKYQMLQRWHERKGAEATVEYLCNLVENFLIKKLKQRFFCNLDSQQITEQTVLDSSAECQFGSKESSLGSICQLLHTESSDVLRDAVDRPMSKKEKSVTPTVQPFWTKVKALHGSFASAGDITYTNIINFNLHPSFIAVVVLISAILLSWMQ